MLAQYGLELALACAALAIIYGLYTTGWILKQDAGNDKMQAIAAAVQEGAGAYLRRQYTTIAMVGVVILIGVGLLLGVLPAIGFLIGAVLSGAAGFAGM